MGILSMALNLISHMIWSLLALGGGLLLLVYLIQDKLVYVPDIEMSRLVFLEPQNYGLEDWEELFLPTPDGEKIQVWFFRAPHSPETAATMLYFHGNADISHRLEHLRALIFRCNLNVMIVSYRGYGKSTGFPSESGLKIDAQTALDYILHQRTEIDKSKVVVFGSSLGGAVAIDLAHSNQDKIHGLLLENTFTCIPDLVDSVMPALKYFKFLVTNPWHSLTKIKTIEKVPVLFLSGQKDELVPEWMMLRLHDACPTYFKRLASFPEGQHVNTFLASGYYTHVKNFISEIPDRIKTATSL